jgi:hypothetical protein
MGSYLAFILLLFFLFAAGGSTHEHNAEGSAVEKNIPENNQQIDENTPEVSVEGDTPEVSVETTTEETTGKDTHDTIPIESSPGFKEESKPEVIREANGPEVSTAEGKLQGTILNITRKGKTIYAFLGIPYASPPTGELRFMVSHAQIIHILQFLALFL